MNLKQLTVEYIIIGLILLMGSAGLVYAQTGGLYDVTWSTIDSGGDTSLSGGAYTLFSTIGQPEAQAAMHSGGKYVLLDGFWPSLQASSVCPTGAGISYSPTNPDPGDAAVFGGRITGGNGVITFTWNFGDNSDPVLGQNTSHSFSAHNVYTVVMTARGDLNCIPPPNVSTATANITVGFGVPTAVVYLPAILKDYDDSQLVADSEFSGNAPAIRPGQVTGLWGITHGGEVIIGWTANPRVEAVSGYHIYHRAQSGHEAFSRLTILPITATTYTDASTVCGQIYYVTALNSAGESPPSAAAFYAPACP